MSEAETLVRILENVVATNTQMAETLLRMEQRQQEQTHALIQLLDRIEARAEAIDARIAADNRALAEILKYVVDTTTRTEQMTGRILTELASRGGSH
jgi:hypothetical protein